MKADKRHNALDQVITQLRQIYKGIPYTGLQEYMKKSAAYTIT